MFVTQRQSAGAGPTIMEAMGITEVLGGEKVSGVMTYSEEGGVFTPTFKTIEGVFEIEEESGVPRIYSQTITRGSTTFELFYFKIANTALFVSTTDVIAIQQNAGAA